MYTKIWISCATLVGVLAGFFAAQKLDLTKFEPDTWAAFGGTLIGASITVSAAYWLMRLQINARRREAAEKSERQQLAARAILALDLSRLCRYTEKCALVAKAIKNRSKLSNRPGGERTKEACPELDLGVTKRLQRLVELLDGDDADQVVELLNCFQVQYARLSGGLNEYNLSGDFDFKFVMVDTVELRLRVDSMFEFSRRKSKHISPPPYADHEVANGLSVLKLTENISDEFRTSLMDTMSKLDPSGHRE